MSIDCSRPKYPHDIHPALVPGIAIDEQRYVRGGFWKARERGQIWIPRD